MIVAFSGRRVMFTDYSFRAHFVFSRQGQSVRMGALGSILVSTNSPAAAASILKPMSSATPTLEPTTSSGQVVLAAKDVNVYYGSFKAVQEVNLECFKGQITALIGPSGCGKTTLLRCFNRMNDLIASARVEGSITYHGIDMYGPEADAGEVRRRIGMVFQKPNPFPKSIFDNVAYGPRVNGEKNKKKLEEINPEAARVVELRAYGGLSNDEIAVNLGISLATVKRRFEFARAFIEAWSSSHRTDG